MSDQTSPFKSGFIAIAGKPNVGKSTLTNLLIGQPIAGVSAKPQTTRKRQLGILTTEAATMILWILPACMNPKISFLSLSMLKPPSPSGMLT